MHSQSRFPPQRHNNRPDSSEDTLANSSPRSNPEMDSLIKENVLCIDKMYVGMYICMWIYIYNEQLSFKYLTHTFGNILIFA